MRAAQTTLRPLIGGEKQYRIPLFQRPYAWTSEQLRQLWADILDQHQILASRSPDATLVNRTHFIGSFVMAPQPALPHGVAPYLVIDGQQRLTTLLIALASIRDALKRTDPREANRMDQHYVLNGSVDGQERYKLVPTQTDREAFFSCADGAGPGSSESRIAAAYRFFSSQFSRPARSGEDEAAVDPLLIQRVILDRLSVIDIVTEADDNPHRIFESLNATGLQLTQADLLRNYLFMLIPTNQEAVYRTVWKPMEEVLLGNENLAAFARCNLMRRLRINVNEEDVYREYQRLLGGRETDEQGIEGEVRELARLARYYRRLIDPSTEPDPVCSAHLECLRRWGAQTASPLLLHVYDLVDRGAATIDELRSVLLNVESFLVRRYLTGVPTNALNKLFVDVMAHLSEGQSIVESLRAQLSWERRYWATDEQVREAVRSRPFYLTGRVEQRRIILERIEASFGHLETVSSSARLTVEHVMPQTLNDEWRALLTSQGDDPDEVCEELVHTLGNLTLTAYNSSLSNNPFERKRQIYDRSHLVDRHGH